MTVGTLTLADFLLARYDEAERRLRDRWTVNVGIGVEQVPPWDSEGEDLVRVTQERSRGQDFNPFTNRIEQLPSLTITETLTVDQFHERHCTRAEPDAFALADLQSKRRIIGEHDESEFCERDAWSHALAILALPYADHPDYRDAWRP